jgi:D-glycero-D-manno-heptose 1,7-bisphosphate phosphatase
MDATKRHDRTVFLDRDGVINVDPGPPGWVMRWEDFRFIDGALAALRRLHENGFTAVVITNQSCVGRGLATLETIQQINAKMAEAVAEAGGRLAGIYVCPHPRTADCSCRKPRPGLIEQAARELALDPSRGFLVGDYGRDICAGAAMGCTTILVATGKDPEALEAKPDHVVGSLEEAVEVIVRLVEGGAWGKARCDPCGPSAPAREGGGDARSRPSRNASVHLRWPASLAGAVEFFHFAKMSRGLALPGSTGGSTLSRRSGG